MGFACNYSDEEVHAQSVVSREARKQHPCHECGVEDLIEPGEEYVVVSSLYNGTWWKEKWHVECWDTACFLWDLGYVWNAGSMFEAWNDAWEVDP